MTMIRGAVIGALALAAASPCAHADPAIKNGAWEITIHSVRTGMKLSPEAAAKMAPGERAKAEKSLAESNGKEVSRTIRTCNRKAVSEKVLMQVMSGKRSCSRRQVSRTETGIEVEITCPAPDASKAVFKYDAPDPETVTSSEDEQRADGVKKHIEASARWVGTCTHAG